jgi:hypothetical protein
MGKSVIDPVYVQTCDICGTSVQDGKDRRPYNWADIKCEADGYDYQGCAVGPGGWLITVCSTCHEAINSFIRDRQKPKEQVILK